MVVDIDAVAVVAPLVAAAAAAAVTAAADINGDDSTPPPPIAGSTIRADAYLVKLSACTEPRTSVSNTNDPA